MKEALDYLLYSRSADENLYGSELTVKSNLQSYKLMQAAGKYRQEGKTYVVQDGDIIFFKFNVSGGGKK